MMKSIKHLSYAMLPLLMLLLVACGTNGVIQGNSTTGSQSAKTPLQVLQSSSDAIKKIKTAHVESTTTQDIQMIGRSDTSNQPDNMNLSTITKGDEILPDQAQLTTTTSITGLSSSHQTLPIILNKTKVYIQGSSGKWSVIDRSMAIGLTPMWGSNLNNADAMLNLAKNAKLTDHGDENINGQSLRHLTATLDQNGLQQLLADNPGMGSQVGQQGSGNSLKTIKDFNDSVDMWIDESTYYVNRITIKFTLKLDTSGLQGLLTPTPGASSNMPSSMSLKMTIDSKLSNFNKPVTITVPSNATPVHSLIQAVS